MDQNLLHLQVFLDKYSHLLAALHFSGACHLMGHHLILGIFYLDLYHIHRIRRS